MEDNLRHQSSSFLKSLDIYVQTALKSGLYKVPTSYIIFLLVMKDLFYICKIEVTPADRVCKTRETVCEAIDDENVPGSHLGTRRLL